MRVLLHHLRPVKRAYFIVIDVVGAAVETVAVVMAHGHVNLMVMSVLKIAAHIHRVRSYCLHVDDRPHSTSLIYVDLLWMLLHLGGAGLFHHGQIDV